jgi:methyltransferase of ATP-grasp peptide maturase system
MHWKDAVIAESRTAFLDGLADPGQVLAPRWRAAFHDVPRDVFVPYFFVPLTDRLGWRLVEPPDQEWARRVWSNDPLITQLDGDDQLVGAARRGEAVQGVSTSSSSAPSLMALMLQALDVREGDRVLEIGSGTGYNTALLCHRLGSDAVTSVDVDTGVVERARARLAGLGYAPTLAAVDGVRGYPAGAPFDRVLATVAAPDVPSAWLEQTRDGGKILFPLDLRNCGGLLPLLTVHNGRAEGSFLPDYGGFMPLRQDRPDTALRAFREVDDEDGTAHETELPADSIRTTGFEFFAALMVGGTDSMEFVPSNDAPSQTWIAQPDGSWAYHTTQPDGTHVVHEGGPTRIWNRVERAYQLWNELGNPARERFGLTATANELIVWLDDPRSAHRWALSR